MTRRTTLLRRLAATVAAASVIVGCSGPPGSGQPVSRADFGDRWPLTVESGYLRCEGAGAVIFRALDGQDYGVNGLATDYPAINPIWASDPSGISPKKDLSALIDAGQKLCQSR